MAGDLNWDVEIIGHPIVREADGLAMSTRNAYLSASERQTALGLSKALAQARQRVADGETEVATLIKETEQLLLAAPGVRIDYISIVDRLELSEQQRVNDRSVLLIAAIVGKTRLIDNSTLM